MSHTSVAIHARRAQTRARRGLKSDLEINAAGEHRLGGVCHESAVSRRRALPAPDIARRRARAVWFGGVRARFIERTVTSFGLTLRPFAFLQQDLVVEHVL